MRTALGTGAKGRARIALAAMTLFALARPADAAKLLSTEGSESGGYGRIALTFDGPVGVKARVSGAVLVVTFGEKATGLSERFAAAMPNYLSAVRRDPDGTGLRIALQKPFRINVQVAGEHAYVDLLPETWTGLLPPLPPEVVADLAKRAYVAETALKAAVPAPVPKPLAVEVAHLPTLTRLTLRLPPGTEAAVRSEGPATRVTIPGVWKLDDTDTRGRLRPAVERFSAETNATAASLVVQPAEGYAVTTDRDDEGLSIDIAKAPSKLPAKAAAKPADPHAEEHDEAAPGKAAPSKMAEHGPDPHAAPEPAPAGARPKVPAAPVRPVSAEAEADVEVGTPERGAVRKPSGGMVFPFSRFPPAALFERAGIATLVFETREPVEMPASVPGIAPMGAARRVGDVAVIRFPAPPGKLVDLLPVGPLAAPTGWELVAGDTLSASDALVANRLPSASGRFGLGVKLPDPGAATWLDLDGERIAVVTTLGRRPSGVPKRQRFVDFELLPSRLGVAVLALADDLSVRPDLDGVAIGREGGLAVSAVERAAEPVSASVDTLAIDRKTWDDAKRGDIRQTIKDQFAAIVELPLSLRGPARLTMARTLLANGFDAEAMTVLAAIAEDDAALGSQREIAILRGLGNARRGRIAETKQALSAKPLLRDPEAALWRGYAAVEAGLWLDADGQLRAGMGIVDRYPDDLQALLRTAIAEAAVETGDLETAKAQIALTDRLSPAPLQRDRLKYLIARIDEAKGHTLAALTSYERLAESGERPVAAAATLRGALLAQTSGKIKAPEAVERLERLMLMWHGGVIEADVIGGLFRLYRETGRWRDAFTAVRRAEANNPDSPSSRVLHTEAMALFDDLFLTELGDSMSGIKAVALYFDFKDFGPVGRRGDEIVRRLADRLVGLDLLDSAAELLQHQVDNRLTGAARASVATRLAAVRIMEAQPMKALETLDSTYLPELPADLRRARMLLRARALSDLSRTDLALETLDDDTAPDAQRLRADILWAARRWREAGEAHETLLGEAWRAGKPLDEAARADVIRAAIGYGLANEPLGLERLKAKYANAMAESADARTFALLTAPNASRTAGFREIAQKASTAQTLAAFLDEYRKRYPENAVPERGKAQAASAAPADTPPG